jgi:hypothetical protein
MLGSAPTTHTVRNIDMSININSTSYNLQTVHECGQKSVQTVKLQSDIFTVLDLKVCMLARVCKCGCAREIGGVCL